MTKRNIIRWGICGLSIFLLIQTLLGKDPAHDNGKGIMITNGGYQVSLAFPEPIKAGINPLSIEILDKRGAPVSGTSLEISSMLVNHTQQVSKDIDAHTMEGMSGMTHDMPGMNVALTETRPHGLQRIPGVYYGAVTFSAPGHWILNSRFNINDQVLDANFPINVVESHSVSFVIFAGFAGLNALIIWAASVSKRRLISA